MADKQYFNEAAPEWDHLRESFFAEAVRSKAISVAIVQSGKMAADVGVGTGFIAEGLIERGLNVQRKALIKLRTSLRTQTRH